MAGPLVKINIGCGPHGKSDWINLDWGILPFLGKAPFLLRLFVRLGILPRDYDNPWPAGLKLHDCRRKFPFKDKSVDFIYMSHFIEHLARYQSIDLLRECKRVLAPQGILRISTPDLKVIAARYLNNDISRSNDMPLKELSENRLDNAADLFMHYFYGYDSWKRPSLLESMKRRFIRRHLWLYDFDSLRQILLLAGFTKITRCQAGSGNVPDIGFLDIHREDSIFIEASL